MIKIWRIVFIFLAIFALQGGELWASDTPLQEESEESSSGKNTAVSSTGGQTPSFLTKGFWDVVEVGKDYHTQWLVGKKMASNLGKPPSEREFNNPKAVSFWATKKGRSIMGAGGIVLAYWLAPESFCSTAGWVAHTFYLSSLQHVLPDFVLSGVGAVCNIVGVA